MDRVLALQTLGEFDDPVPECCPSTQSGVCSTSSMGYLNSTCSIECNSGNEIDW